MDVPVIGIDLGTTFTVAAIYKNGIPEIIPNLEGDRLTTSAIFYYPTNDEIAVGRLATSLELTCPRNFLYDMKRIIGRSFDDVYVASFIKRESGRRMGLMLRKNEEDMPCIYLDKYSESKTCCVTAEDVSAGILAFMKKSAEKYLGTEIKDAIISVPAYFSYSQKQATKRAATLVGFNDVKLISEPVAAAIHYTHTNKITNQRLLVVDLGGGTLDVSIVEVNKDEHEIYKVVSTEGDMCLGGRDFDEVIFEYLKKEVEKKIGPLKPDVRKDQRMLCRLNKFANKYKHALSFKEAFKLPIEYGSDDDFEIELTRSKFEELSSGLFDRVIDKVQKCLNAVHLSVKDIDKMVLAGGSTRIPKILQLLKERFTDNKIFTDLNPDEAVASGASIHAVLISESIHRCQVYKLVEQAPHSLGISTKYNVMEMAINKGTTLPTYKSVALQTSKNDQLSVVFSLYEGERKNSLHNRKIGTLKISNLPKGKAGDIKFEVTVSLDKDGLLHVSASEKETKQSKQLTVNMSELILCDTVLYNSTDYEKLLEEDMLFEEFYELRKRMDAFCNDITYFIDAASYRENKDLIIKEVEETCSRCDRLHFKQIDTLTNIFKTLNIKMEKLTNTTS